MFFSKIDLFNKKPIEITIEAIEKSLKGFEQLHREELKKLTSQKVEQSGFAYSESTYFRALKKLLNNNIIKRSDDQLYYSTTTKHIIPGLELLNDRNGKIYAPPTIVNAGLGIYSGRPQCYFNPEAYYVVFSINETPLYLKISKKITEFKIHIAKMIEHERGTQNILENNHGKNLIRLRLPFETVTSCRVHPEEQAKLEKSGHLLLSFQNNELLVQDLDSTNGTEASSVDNKTADDLLNDFIRTQNKGTGTTTCVVGEDNLELLVRRKASFPAEPNIPIKSTIPILIVAARRHPILII